MNPPHNEMWSSQCAIALLKNPRLQCLAFTRYINYHHVTLHLHVTMIHYDLKSQFTAWSIDGVVNKWTRERFGYCLCSREGEECLMESHGVIGYLGGMPFCVFSSWPSMKKLIGGHEKCFWNGTQSTSKPLLLEDNDRWDEQGGAVSPALLSWKDLTGLRYLWYVSLNGGVYFLFFFLPLSGVIEYGSREATPLQSHKWHHLQRGAVFSARKKTWRRWGWNGRRKATRPQLGQWSISRAFSLHLPFPSRLFFLWFLWGTAALLTC